MQTINMYQMLWKHDEESDEAGAGRTVQRTYAMTWCNVKLAAQQYENALMLYEMYPFGLQTLYMP